jgi:hypothetical protein
MDGIVIGSLNKYEQFVPLISHELKAGTLTALNPDRTIFVLLFLRVEIN